LKGAGKWFPVWGTTGTSGLTAQRLAFGNYGAVCDGDTSPKRQEEVRHMPKVTYVGGDGALTTLDVPVGTSVMKAAVLNGVDGIVGECGGNLMCATCHVYVDAEWAGRSGGREEVEEEMLEEAAAPVKAESRLSCQLVASQDLDGLVVHLPERQV
jgi:2Fe-2S ferredoxin